MPSGKRLAGREQAAIVEHIRAEMARAGNMKQSELARLAGVPETTLSKIFNGDSVLDVEQTSAIAAVFGLPMWELAMPPEAGRERGLAKRLKRAVTRDRDDIDVDRSARDLGL
ncbi:helix-turn-helix transcriptional regulator [Antrihabitans sp. YC2-6]|uniref:helix-turn-helix domain-containing protein n=1 Tax=Antrihabitans sp. YC2-6 TaxID=2799498 RepID=UPI0018F76E01|nr:helix-turn-helix transcriptional regulator [Antrihabitans sp. YC2-6]MBJ8344277.1 helix-turn-helix transcriptional regulator [Antrihabitans sp. YC2-6]